jgi:hypothetical protein
MSTPFVIRILGIFLGILARTLLPWLRKLKEGEVRGFSARYVYSALASLAIGVVAGSAGDTFEDLFKLFCLAFGFGFGWNALVLEGGAWAGAGKGPTLAEDAPAGGETDPRSE